MLSCGALYIRLTYYVSYLTYEENSPLIILTRNRPESRNSLTAAGKPLCRLLATLERIERDTEASRVILTSDGPSFNAGVDIREVN